MDGAQKPQYSEEEKAGPKEVQFNDWGRPIVWFDQRIASAEREGDKITAESPYIQNDHTTPFKFFLFKKRLEDN
jgi:hypothetical protein